jgi:hypothetical protein
LFFRIRDNFFRKKKSKKSKHVVEIFDVIIYSKKRLEIWTPEEEPYLLQWCDYDAKAKQLLSEDPSRARPVYEEKSSEPTEGLRDPKTIDISNPEFQQVHFLRFEKGNKKLPNPSKFTITDIDLWMDGNISLSRYI